MPEHIQLYATAYFAAVSLLAMVLTMYDKRAAKSGSRRIRESTLLLVSILGGSVAMFTTMRLIRHKTKHTKFMMGISVIIVLQIAAVLLIWHCSRSKI